MQKKQGTRLRQGKLSQLGQRKMNEIFPLKFNVRHHFASNDCERTFSFF